MNQKENKLELISALNKKVDEILEITVKMAEYGIANESNPIFKSLMVQLESMKEMIYDLEISLYQ